MKEPNVILGDALQGGAANSTGRLVKALIEQGVPIERWHFSKSPQKNPEHYRSLDDRGKRPIFERVLKNLSRSWADHFRRKRHANKLKKILSFKLIRFFHIYCVNFNFWISMRKFF